LVRAFSTKGQARTKVRPHGERAEKSCNSEEAAG
jgi:hypothetical protein